MFDVRDRDGRQLLVVWCRGLVVIDEQRSHLRGHRAAAVVERVQRHICPLGVAGDHVDDVFVEIGDVFQCLGAEIDKLKALSAGVGSQRGDEGVHGLKAVLGPLGEAALDDALELVISDQPGILALESRDGLLEVVGHDRPGVLAPVGVSTRDRAVQQDPDGVDVRPMVEERARDLLR